ncbi:MAG: response regulator [Candidatus Riflebacteria bacterium]|nr:response regulator [Candidatus Riflebacteria bacterium]
MKIPDIFDQYVPNVLIVDDTPANLKVLCEMLKGRGFKVRPVPSGKLALQAAEKEIPDIILLDIMMPEMDGYEVCRKLKENSKLKDVPIIFISALNDTKDIVKALTAGGVDYITKPFQFEEVNARSNTHLKVHHLQRELEKHNFHLEELVKEQVKEISSSQMATIFALAKLAEYRDDDTGTHLIRVRKYCKMLAIRLSESALQKQIDLSFIENLSNTSPLHDIGKVGIPDIVLLKPGKVTPAEFEIIKKHTIIGSNTMEEVLKTYTRNTFIHMGISIARSHHEKWNGSGYPDGLSREGIPLCARIVAVADVYDALRTKRVYKPAFSHEKAREIIISDSEKHFDPLVVKAFIEIENDFIAAVEV